LGYAFNGTDPRAGSECLIRGNRIAEASELAEVLSRVGERIRPLAGTMERPAR